MALAIFFVCCGGCWSMAFFAVASMALRGRVVLLACSVSCTAS